MDRIVHALDWLGHNWKSDRLKLVCASVMVVALVSSAIVVFSVSLLYSVNLRECFIKFFTRQTLTTLIIITILMAVNLIIAIADIRED